MRAEVTSPPSRASASEDQGCHLSGGVFLDRRQYVGVRVEGDADVGMSEALADDLRLDAGGEGSGGVAVAKVVEANAGEAGGERGRSKSAVNRWGWTSVPSSRVKTSPVSFHSSRQPRRSFACSFWCVRRAPRVSGSRATER